MTTRLVVMHKQLTVVNFLHTQTHRQRKDQKKGRAHDSVVQIDVICPQFTYMPEYGRELIRIIVGKISYF